MIFNPILKKPDTTDGDGIIPVGTKRITDNGTHDVAAYANAEVDVETPTDDLLVSVNGEYTPPEGKHFRRVSVNVPSGGGGVVLPPVENPASSSEVLDGYGAIDAAGNAFAGSMPNNGAISKTFDGITEKSVTIPKGFTSGGTVSLTDDIDNEVDTQAELISQVKAVLTGIVGELNSLTIYANASDALGLPGTFQFGVVVNDGAAEYHSVTIESEYIYDEDYGDYRDVSETVEVCTLPAVNGSDTVKIYFTNPRHWNYYTPSVNGNGCTIDAELTYGEGGDVLPLENCTVTVTNVAEGASITITIPTES